MEAINEAEFQAKVKALADSKRLIERWESQRGANWVELWESIAGYEYKTGNGAYGCSGGTTEQKNGFLSDFRQKLESGYFLPDKAKAGLKKVNLYPAFSVSGPDIMHGKCPTTCRLPGYCGREANHGVITLAGPMLESAQKLAINGMAVVEGYTIRREQDTP